MKTRTGRPDRRQDQAGSALLLVLCAVGLLSLVVLGLMTLAKGDQMEAMAHLREFRARQLAQSGLAIALNPAVQANDPVLVQHLSDTESFTVHIGTEGARLQINKILVQDQKDVFRKLMNTWGLSDTEASTVYDCLADWVDRNNEKRLNGAEQDQYPAGSGLPLNRPFRSLDEMSQVKNIDILTAKKPDWRDYFTVWSDGRLDANEAPAELLALVTGQPIGKMEQFVAQRAGQDGQLYTLDDVRYTDVNQVRLALGMTEKAFQDISANLGVDDSVRRITATGRAGDVERTITVVVKRNTVPPIYFEWTEQ